jgi:hypothetical protein
MLTVHKLSTNHLILADNDVAKQARETGIEEVLVVIDRGQIVRVHTPPGEADEFASDDDWIFAAIRDAYARGINVAMEGKIAIRTVPAGWTHWSDLKPGSVAYNGDPEASAVVIGSNQTFSLPRSGEVFNACHLGVGTTCQPFHFKPSATPPWPFFKVLRVGLTGDQMRAVVTAVESGEYIEVALANLAPVEA